MQISKETLSVEQTLNYNLLEPPLLKKRKEKKITSLIHLTGECTYVLHMLIQDLILVICSSSFEKF